MLKKVEGILKEICVCRLNYMLSSFERGMYMRNKSKKREKRILVKLIRENHKLKKDIQTLKGFIQTSSVHSFRDAKVQKIQEISEVLEKYPDVI